ncbi:MAG TPA: hypothetical protein VFN37_09845, partial [Candidatus Baltobacteraceae bacterium]|nr:hypothetical protein [Candidatus Baltobacteraceae bacterium]
MPFIAALLMAIAPSLFSNLHFRNIGPMYGRIDAVSGVAGDARTYYAGGLGGLFKSNDGGVTWESVFNHEPVSSIGAIAVAPSDANLVYIGTGEPNLRNDVAFGEGMWKSADAGKTWQHVGLDASGAVSRIVVDPADPNRVFAAVLGDVYKASTERGIYRTLNGGKTWQRVLYTDDRTGGSSVAIDPADPKHLIAGMWEGWRTPYHLNSGGPSDGVYESHDGGDHWTRLRGDGLPAGTTGRIAIAFAPSNPARIYALIESEQGTLWRSDDHGATWKLVNKSHGIDQRPFYFTSLAVDPKDENHVYFMSVQMWQSTDGGATAKALHGTGGGDYHSLWIDPQNPQRMAAGDDQGAEVSNDGPKTWLNANIFNAQAYHVDTDDRTPYTVCAEDQDTGSACGPSNSLAFGGIAPGDFFGAGGGESGWIVFDQLNPNLIYGDGYQGALTQYDRRTQQSRSIDVWPEDAMGWPASQLKYRFQWTSPLAMSPEHPHRLYMGGNKVFQTDDGGARWRAISGDLTRNDKRFQQFSGGLTRDNTSVEYYDTVFTIAESPLRAGELWVGTDDGLVWLTRDGGSHWTNVTPAALKGDAPGAWARIDYVDPSPFDPATAYMVADYHKSGGRAPHLYKTHDYGRTWTVITGDLPQDSYARMIKADPVRRGMLYAGTETGLWLSYDEGAHWISLQSNLPTVPVYDFKVQKRFDDLVVGTHGRALWILDDLHPLQELTENIAAQPLHLFTLRPAYRYRIGAYTPAPFTGENPQYGADINFYLKTAPAAKAKITAEILDGGRVIRTIEVKNATAGVNRVWWDLRYEDMHPVKDYVPWGARGFAGPLVLPGRYTVRVADGTHTASGTVDVRMDPRSHASMTALREQLAFLQRVRGDLAGLTKTIDRLNARKSQAGADRSRIDALLHRIYEPEVTQGEDALRYPQQVYGKL